jgi:proteasome accessory factor C
VTSRIADIRVLPVESDAPPLELRDLSDGLVRPAADDPQVVLEVGPAGRWVTEYYTHEESVELPDGGLRITLRTPDPAGLLRLALRLGADGRIVAPAALAAQARGTAMDALALYGEAVAGGVG